MPRPRIIVCDLDGTLFHRESGVSAENLKALRELGEAGVVRVIATGRSWKGSLVALPPDFPIDYLIFSCGAGCVDWRSSRLLLSKNLTARQAHGAVRRLVALDADFMVHAPIPEGHQFAFRATGNVNPDFERRLARHRANARPWDERQPPAPASQLIAIDPLPRSETLWRTVRRSLPSLSVIRTTSPLDGESTWIEIFAPDVNKARAVAWLAERHSARRTEILAIGNDFNDLQMLRLAGRGFAIEGAPEELLRAFPVVSLGNAIPSALSRWRRSGPVSASKTRRGKHRVAPSGGKTARPGRRRDRGKRARRSDR